MKKYWYLVASLPMLHLGEKPPMDAAAFRAACAGHLSDDETAAVNAALENREPPAGAAVDWWNSEVQLRDASIRIRAKNRGTDPGRFLRPYTGFSASIEKAVTDAFTRQNPLEQQMELDRARWMLSDEMALNDPFGFPGVLAFAVKVRLAERWAGLGDEAGLAKVEELIDQATAL
ncbi:MAG: hypothetical protein AB7E95_04420 [Kiritimatiellales bacterium]